MRSHTALPVIFHSLGAEKLDRWRLVRDLPQLEIVPKLGLPFVPTAAANWLAGRNKPSDRARVLIAKATAGDKNAVLYDDWDLPGEATSYKYGTRKMASEEELAGTKNVRTKNVRISELQTKNPNLRDTSPVEMARIPLRARSTWPMTAEEKISLLSSLSDREVEEIVFGKSWRSE